MEYICSVQYLYTQAPFTILLRTFSASNVYNEFSVSFNFFKYKFRTARNLCYFELSWSALNFTVSFKYILRKRHNIKTALFNYMEQSH